MCTFAVFSLEGDTPLPLGVFGVKAPKPVIENDRLHTVVQPAAASPPPPATSTPMLGSALAGFDPAASRRSIKNDALAASTSAQSGISVGVGSDGDVSDMLDLTVPRAPSKTASLNPTVASVKAFLKTMAAPTRVQSASIPAASAAPRDFYRESQVGAQCAVHATNAAVGFPMVTPALLGQVEIFCALSRTLEAGLIAADAVEHYRQLMAGFQANGNFSHISFSFLFELLEIPFVPLHALKVAWVSRAGNSAVARLALPDIDMSRVHSLILSTKPGLGALHYITLRFDAAGSVYNLDSIGNSPQAAQTPMTATALRALILRCEYACVLLDRRVEERRAALLGECQNMPTAFALEIGVLTQVYMRVCLSRFHRVACFGC